MKFGRLFTSMAALLVMGFAAFASPRAGVQADPVSGNYEGIAKSEALGDIPIKVTIKNASGKLSGNIDTPQGAAPITDGTFADGKVTLKFDAGGNEGTVTAQIKDGKIVGNWTLAGQTGTLELKRAGDMAATPKTPAPAAAPAAGDPLSGDWDASADAAGQAYPFKLKLALAGDKVTGESTSDMGSVTLSKGMWTANKLSFVLDTPNGSISFTGTIKDGKLVGDFDFAGQMQGKWEASKKK